MFLDKIALLKLIGLNQGQAKLDHLSRKGALTYFE